MTAILLTGFVGTGTRSDPFRADVTHDGDADAIYDLRADQSVADGWCIAVITGETSWSTTGQSYDLTDSLNQPIPGRLRGEVGAILGVDIPPGTRIGEALMLRVDAGLIVPERDGKRRLTINGVILYQD